MPAILPLYFVAGKRMLWTEKAHTNWTGVQWTTYKMGGPLQEAYQPQSLSEAVELLTRWMALEDNQRPKLTLLGWGGNSVVAQAGIAGVTLITRKLDWVRPEADGLSFTFGAGVHSAKVAATAQKHGLAGGEFMIGIPGTVGGMVRMNAGALGQNTSERLISARVFNATTGVLEDWPAERFGFRYRHSEMDSAKHFVLEATFAFVPGDAATIAQKMTDSVQFRRAHHPTEPNGGSVFRNPLPTESNPKPPSAGMLLDGLGARGDVTFNKPPWEQGGVQVSPRHANFIVNVGVGDEVGTSTDVLRLMRRMQQAVIDAHGITLRPENVLLGDANAEEQALWQLLWQ
ncbi:MAG: UDP-N-acetylmuramate dehydrogenase [Vampirovibrionales bacterium]|nr:UDP-N-acetylmuramate dehydrogenase [Vampirovibrionales bacterium]